MASEEAYATPHDELCDEALKHYDEISIQAKHHNSLIPAAIKYYKRWVPTGERKIVYTPGTLITALEEGWVFDPWLNSRGGPIAVGGPVTIAGSITPADSPVYWVLVRGSPEQIAGLEPFVELPSKEEPVGPQPYGLETLFISYGEKDPSGAPKKPPEGFVIMHKDHIYAKGTVYTLQPGAVKVKPKPWDIAKDIAEISHLGVDEAHDALTALIKKEMR